MVTPLGDYLAPPLIGAFSAANDQGTKSLESRQKEGLNSIARMSLAPKEPNNHDIEPSLYLPWSRGRLRIESVRMLSTRAAPPSHPPHRPPGGLLLPPAQAPARPMEVPGTFRGVVVMAPCDRRGFGDDVERCMWCACPFGSTSDDDMRRMAAMCTTESGDDLWEGDYIRGCCGYLRHRATEGARGAAGAGGGGGGGSGGVRPSGRFPRGR